MRLNFGWPLGYSEDTQKNGKYLFIPEADAPDQAQDGGQSSPQVAASSSDPLDAAADRA